MLPAFPQSAEQMQVTVEQWDADLALDTIDRIGAITAPTLVVAGFLAQHPVGASTA
jgi:hypothetical protein